MITIVWFRQDLRLADNPALTHATGRGEVLPVYIRERSARGHAAPGGASRWWLHHSLTALAAGLGGMAFFIGDAGEVLRRLVRETGAEAVVWNRCYEPHAIARDMAIKADLRSQGIEVESFSASLLHEPWDLRTGAGGPYKVFTPYYRAASARGHAQPTPAPEAITLADCDFGEPLDAVFPMPENPNWAAGWSDIWQPGEAGALSRFGRFIDGDLPGYAILRDRPDLTHVSRLSPHLHHGEISPRQVAAKARFVADSQPERATDVEKFVAELHWREFSYHLLYHFPDLSEANWRPAFDAFVWRNAPGNLAAWQEGRTGYPLVDAAMRELWATGYMHNRMRMVAASFLIKHLRIDWRKGQDWFWDTLVDVDLANNAASWQWVAGSGVDAAPFFRIFNPVTQGARFDPEGAYVRRWCPELAGLSVRHIHAPWKAPDAALQEAGIILGETYPHPVVDHAEARHKALEAYEAVKKVNAR